MTRFQRPVASRVAAGFTLIELMITVAVLGILAAIAMASYDFAMIKARRGAAKGCLQEMAQYMERFYTTNLAYDKDTSGGNVTPPTCSQDVTPFYTASLATGEPTASTYKFQAVPTSKQHDGTCGTLTIDNKGVKTASGTGGVAGCW